MELVPAGTKLRNGSIVDESKLFASREDCRAYTKTARANHNSSDLVEDESMELYRAVFRSEGRTILQQCKKRPEGRELYLSVFITAK